MLSIRTGPVALSNCSSKSDWNPHIMNPSFVDSLAWPTSDTVHRTTLPDGTRLLIKPNPTSPSVVIQGLILSGTSTDPPGKDGLTRFMTECLARGTTTHSAEDLYNIAESLGASFHFTAGVHTLSFSAKCLADDFDVIISLLADCLQDPTFPIDEIEHVRGEELTDIKEREHDTRYVSDRLFRQMSYPADHPYSRPFDGTYDSISNITRNDVMALYQNVIPRSPIILVIVGAVDSDSASEIVAKYLHSFSSDKSTTQLILSNIPRNRVGNIEHTIVSGKVQIDLLWGQLGPRRIDSDFLRANLANLLLGGFGLMGRLGLRIREEQGVAY